MHEVVPLDSIFECFGHFVGKGGQNLILCEIEFHLLILEDLTESRRIEKVHQYEGAFVEFDVVPVCLYPLLYPLDHVLIGVLTRLQPQLVLLVLVAFVDIDHPQRNRQCGRKFGFLIGKFKRRYFLVQALLIATVNADLEGSCLTLHVVCQLGIVPFETSHQMSEHVAHRSLRVNEMRESILELGKIESFNLIRIQQ